MTVFMLKLTAEKEYEEKIAQHTCESTKCKFEVIKIGATSLIFIYLASRGVEY